MAYEQRDLTGSSFKNEKKREGKIDPDYTGTMIVGGQEFWLDSWIKNHPKSPTYDPSKKTFLSHSLRPKGQQQARPATQQRQTRTAPPPPPPSDNDGGFHDDDQTWK